MDRFLQEGSVCACPPVNYRTSNIHDMMPPRSLLYNHSKLSDHNIMSQVGSSQEELCGTTRSHTLENVLMGKIPAAYSHLTSHRRSPYSQGRHHQSHTFSSPNAQHSLNIDIPARPHNFATHGKHSLPSPSFSSSSDFSLPRENSPSWFSQGNSPHSISNLSMRSQETSSPKHVSFQRYSQSTYSSSPQFTHISSSPASSCSSISCQDEPIDLSFKSSSPVPVRSESTDSAASCDTSSSLLRNLLCRGKREHEGQFGNFRDLHDSMDIEHVSPIRNVSGTTRVTLAKKNMYPVGSRVSDWLVKIIQFSKSIPEFVNMSHNDKVSLILNSWTRLLLLYMAESNFQFVVTPLQTDATSSDGAPPSPDEPTMKSVETIQSFIRKCQNMDLDQKEFAFLRMAVLFNTGYNGLDRPEQVDQLNSLIQQLLKEHVQTSRPNDVMHYSRLLLCLPALYGINCKMIENLFCKHINGNMDIDMLLKEMLQNL